MRTRLHLSLESVTIQAWIVRLSNDGRKHRRRGTGMSAKPIKGRMTARAEGEVTVFLIGMRINKFRAPRDWWPVVGAMSRMLRELSREKGSGLLGARTL